MASVYTIYWKKPEEYTSDLHVLDGDFDKVFPTGYGFDATSNNIDAPENMLRQPDRTYIEKRSIYQGVPVDMTHLPTRVQYTGRPEEMTDLMLARSRFLMSSRMKDVIEGLEPGKHQFKPVELVGKDGGHLADHFWFNPCARVDSMDREHTTHEFYREREWKFVSGGKYVASLERTKGHHLWIDARLHSGSVFISQTLHDALAEANPTGLGIGELEAV